MLKTNSKAAREKIQHFINTHVDFSGYDLEKTPETTAEINKAIFDCFLSEAKYSRLFNEQEKFIDWCSGLPSVLDCSYYLNRRGRNVRRYFRGNIRRKGKIHRRTSRKTVFLFNLQGGKKI